MTTIRIKTVKTVIPTGFSDFLGLNTKEPGFLKVKIANGGSVYARINVTHVASKVPGFAFSRYYRQV
jgi:hypothetical protein